MFLEPDVMREPMLPPVRTLVDGISHRSGIDGGRQLRIDSDGRDPSSAETGKSFPGLPAIPRFIHRVVGGDIENVGVSRMQCDRDDRLAFSFTTGEREQAQQPKQQARQPLRQAGWSMVR